LRHSSTENTLTLTRTSDPFLETWKEIAPIYSVLENFFEFTVGEVLKYVYWLADMNRDAIRTLEQTDIPA
jgi:hypothetical protein